jgi:Cytochrome c554 and c-prime
VGEAHLDGVSEERSVRRGATRVAEIAWVSGLIAAGVALSVALGGIPTTRTDFFIPGTQINKLQQRIQSVNSCAFCHGGYDEAHEPLTLWASSMMAQSARDPIFHACLAVSNQDANFAGELCLRCHAPGGWLGGRVANDPTGASLNATDLEGVNCNFCHRMVDPEYHPGQSPVEDELILSSITPSVTTPHSGSFVMDPIDRRRGPFDISYLNPHPWLQSPFHASSRMCATCHDVSNPVYQKMPDGSYGLTPFNQPAPSTSKYTQFPVERTFSEWSLSLFAQGPVEMNGRFGINQTAVSSCQDCHMPGATGTGCHPELGPVTRDNLPSHFFNGANTWVLRAVRALNDDATTYLSEASVNASIARAEGMLRAASDLELTQAGRMLNVRILNYSGHKLPTGYAEGRRMWINVKFLDAAGGLVAERGGYDAATAVLDRSATKVYECDLGLDAAAAAATGKPEGPGFHFAINNKVFKDNRIPPMGFSNAAFESVQALPVNASYADGQYWDDTLFELPQGATRAEVRVFHQTTTKEYIEFLRDANTTNSAGQIAYDQWVLNGKSAPVEMDHATLDLYGCIADINMDGGVDGADIEAFFHVWEVSDPAADLNLDGGVDGSDIEAFFRLWEVGC